MSRIGEGAGGNASPVQPADRSEGMTMDLDFTAEERAFRDEVRSFLRDHLPAAVRHKVLNGIYLEREDYLAWQRVLHARGWGGPSWPVAFGGTGWDPVRQYLFDDACAEAGAPRLVPFGLKMVAPVLMAFGSAAQQQRFLPPILAGEAWWCQGYSEPGAGSDLAALRTRAVRDGAHYVVDGQKTWTTFAHYADWMFCLVRTDPAAKPQRGISFLLIDMRSPGIRVRPIRTLDGAHEVNEVWLEGVRVPVVNLVGEENRGWTYAKFLLGHERSNIAGIGIARRELARLKRLARSETCDGRPLLEAPLFAARVARVEIELIALEITNLRVLSAEAEQRAPGVEASILKIRGSEIQQEIFALMTEALGLQALPYDREAMAAGYAGDCPLPVHARTPTSQYLNMRKLSIYGGSNEIQRNIIARSMLGL
ncbi:acyl-CoA dehydrogenase family protein [Thauera aromatica]|uniref:acyl-CoA dehydrogenase family protein n=1 Tax=Thauera aromatica TaxID=59405 RepID=UPI001FFCCFE8|nr:acyl-CoA dehydrogenase family protein [Thauera aromatica]MCK2088924.1 acyl-CoA dehydrogenase family protein [Thauera aromatica]